MAVVVLVDGVRVRVVDLEGGSGIKQVGVSPLAWSAPSSPVTSRTLSAGVAAAVNAMRAGWVPVHATRLWGRLVSALSPW